MAELVRQIMADADQPGRAVDVQTYNSRASEVGAPTYTALMFHYDGWREVCERMGLQPCKRGYTSVASSGRENLLVDKQVAEEIESDLERAAAAREDERPHGLPVSRVYTRLGDRRVYCELK